tara:strand:+ start:1443 stop:1700 length:258 start_codon:yes stop_codon:yes gene_type:complete
MATAAHAGGRDFSFFSCGLQLGNTKKVAEVKTPPRKKQAYVAKQPSHSLDSSGPAVFNFNEATQRKTGQRRLPRIFTFAKVGCSW